MRGTASDKSYTVIYPRDAIRMRDKGMAHWHYMNSFRGKVRNSGRLGNPLQE